MDINSLAPPVWAKKVLAENDVFPFGSRSMSLRPDWLYQDPSASDWDFSAQYTEDAQRALERNGFTFVGNPDKASIWKPKTSIKSPVQQKTAELHYADALCVAVLTKEVAGERVDVVLHSNEQLFRKVWVRIDTSFYYKYIWKRSPEFAFRDLDRKDQKKAINEIMNQLYKVYR